jgi:hypothetical protein
LFPATSSLLAMVGAGGTIGFVQPFARVPRR